MTDIATLGIKVDATQVDTASASLDRLADSGKRSETSTNGLGGAASKSGRDIGQYADEVRALRDRIDPLNAVSLKMYADLSNNTKLFKAGAIGAEEYALANNLVRTEAEAAAIKIEKAAEAITHVGGVSSVTTREILTMMREAGRGDFGRMAGSASILTQSLGVMQYIMTPVGIGLIALAAAGGLYAAAMIEGEAEQTRFNNSLKVFGNAAGITESAYQQMAVRIGEATQSSIASNEGLASALMRTNSFTAQQIEDLVTDAQKLASATGDTADSVIKDFSEMAKSPGEFAAEFQSKYNGLITPAQVRFVEELENTGDKQKALEAIIKIATDNIAKNTQENVGIIIRAWNSATNAVSDFWTMLKNVGKDTGTQGKINDLTGQINDLQYSQTHAWIRTASGDAYYDSQIKALIQTRSALQEVQNTADKLTESQARTTRETRASGEAYKDLFETYGTGYDRELKFKNDVKKLDAEIALARKYNNTAELKDLIAHRSAIVEGLRNEDMPSTANAGRTHRAPVDQAGNQLAKLQAEIEGQDKLNLSYAEGKYAELEATAAKAAAVAMAGKKFSATQAELEGQRQLTLEVSKYVGTVLKTAAADENKADVTRDVADAVRSGRLAYSEASKEITLQNTLLPMQQVLAKLTGKAYDDLAAAIGRVKQAYKDQNAAQGELQIEGQIDALTDENILLQVQLDTLGQTNDQRKIALDLAKARIALEKAGVSETSDTGQALLNQTRARDTGQDTLAQSELAKTLSTKEPVENINRIAAAVQDATKDFQTLFGTAGNGFAMLANEAASYAQKKLEIDARLRESEQRNAEGSVQLDHDRRQASADLAQAEIAHYGNIISSAKNMFDSKSKGYKALEAVEKAYRLFQLVSAAINLATHAQSIALDSAATVSHVANSGTRATASGIEAIAKVFASIPPPFNFIVAGVVAAALIAFGVKMFGGHSGGAGAATPTDTSSSSADVLSSSMKSPYSTLPGPGGLYNPSTVGQSPGQISSNDNYYSGSGSQAGNGGGLTVAPVYNIHAPGADAGVVDKIQTVLNDHQAQTVQLARQLAFQDQVAASGRQRIGSGG